MKKFYIIVFTLLLFNCSKDNETNQVRLRVSNTSAYDYKNIIVRSNSFNNLNAGGTSDYQIFEYAYRYDFIELQIDGKTYTIQPIDFVGESKLKNGDYTYAIDASNSDEQYGKLSLSLIED